MHKYFISQFSFLIALALIFSATSCTKCTGTFCVKNAGQSSFVYSWDSNQLLDTLKPNAETCQTGFTVNINPTYEEYLIFPFNSSVGDYMFEVKECNSTVELE